MLVSHAKRFIFLKTRKTAGTSIEMLLEPFCAPSRHIVREATPALVSPEGIVGRRLQPRPTDLVGVDWHHHMPAAAVAEAVGPEVWADYLKVSAVRDPFDRVVSHFHWTWRDRPLPADVCGAFRAFVREPWQDDRTVVSIGGALVIDRFVRYERLRDDLAALARRLGMEFGGLPNAKDLRDRRGGRAVADYYDDETVRIVRERMAWVFENFDYPQEPLPAPIEAVS